MQGRRGAITDGPCSWPDPGANSRRCRRASSSSASPSCSSSSGCASRCGSRCVEEPFAGPPCAAACARALHADREIDELEGRDRGTQIRSCTDAAAIRRPPEEPAAAAGPRQRGSPPLPMVRIVSWVAAYATRMSDIAIARHGQECVVIARRHRRQWSRLPPPPTSGGATSSDRPGTTAQPGRVDRPRATSSSRRPLPRFADITADSVKRYQEMGVFTQSAASGRGPERMENCAAG